MYSLFGKGEWSRTPCPSGSVDTSCIRRSGGSLFRNTLQCLIRLICCYGNVIGEALLRCVGLLQVALNRETLNKNQDIVVESALGIGVSSGELEFLCCWFRQRGACVCVCVCNRRPTVMGIVILHLMCVHSLASLLRLKASVERVFRQSQDLVPSL